MAQRVGETLVFAVAQRPFEINGNFFSTLVPLMSSDDQVVNASDFPNRGLAWWMVRGNLDVTKSRPGRLLVAEVEEAHSPDKTDFEKDSYQVRYDTVEVAGAKRLLEIVTPEGHTSMEPRAIINGATARLDHEPPPFVLVRLGKMLYGPFKSEIEEIGQRSGRYAVRFTRGVVDRPIYMFDQSALTVLHLRAEVALDDASPSRTNEPRKCNYEIVPWSLFEKVCNASETITLSTDDEAIARVAKEIFTRSKRRELIRQFKELLSASSSVPSDVRMEDLKRVQEIALNLERPAEALDRLIGAMIDGGFLDEEVKRATEAAAARAVGERVSTIRAEAEQELKEIRHTLEGRRKELDVAEAEFERLKRRRHAEIDAEVEAKKSNADQLLADQQQSLDRQKVELDRQREVIENNLSSVVKSFREEKDKLIADYLAISPILESAGVIRGFPASEDPKHIVAKHTETPPVALSLPAALARYQIRAADLSEEDFFDRFARHVQNRGFSYRAIDLLSFHVSVKCSDLSIIGGVSGTGKSSLPWLYAEALAGDDSEQMHRYLPIDVSPAWTNPSDVLGYVNLLDRSFHPGPSGLFTHMAWAALEARAKGGDSGVYLICLDEMNLSHVEYYFSGFIQALSRAPETRSVTVFDQGSVTAIDPAWQWARLPVGDNVRFIGTVNFDETTKAISQRVLDRANLLQLGSGPFLGGQRQVVTTSIRAGGEPVRANDLHSWINDRPLDKSAAEVLEALQSPLRILGCPLTPRRLGAIARFLSSAPLSLCPPEAALDLQVAQRILPQIKGLFRQEARSALGQVRAILEKNKSAFEQSLLIVRDLQASEELMEPAAWDEG